MSRILTARDLNTSPGPMTATSSSFRSKTPFQCRDDGNGRRPSISDLESSTELSPDDLSHEVVDTEKAEMADETGSQVDQDESENELHSFPSPSTPNKRNSEYYEDQERSSLADLDFSVIVALISPVGSWLFGHDHLKNLFVVLLLVFYLHQLIEVPWKLYNSSRLKRSSPDIPPAREADHPRIRLARSELRTHELSYLILTLLSPFLGAFLLRKGIATVTGEDTMPWFSTSLFVLATGVRPWSHLVSRLRQRTRDLHDAIHYPSPEVQLIADGHLQAVVKRMEDLECELRTVKRVMAVNHNVSQTHDEMFGAIEDVERIIKRQERKVEVARSSTESRLVELEATILRLESENKRQLAIGQAEPGALVRQLVIDALEIPHAIWTTVAVGHFRNSKSSLVRGEKQPNTIDHSSSNFGHMNPVKRTSRLETIPEYGDENNVVFVSANSGPRHMKRRKSSRQPDPQLGGTGSPVDFAVQAMLLPYHLSVRLLVAIIPPVQKIFS